jgi:hypothetical protein
MNEAAREAVFERLVHSEGVHFAVYNPQPSTLYPQPSTLNPQP